MKFRFKVADADPADFGVNVTLTAALEFGASTAESDGTVNCGLLVEGAMV